MIKQRTEWTGRAGASSGRSESCSRIFTNSKTPFILIIPHITFPRALPSLPLTLSRARHILQSIGLGFLSLDAVPLNKDVAP
jgi:hypothetical protein